MYLNSKYEMALRDPEQVAQRGEKRLKEEARAEARRVWRVLQDDEKTFYTEQAEGACFLSPACPTKRDAS